MRRAGGPVFGVLFALAYGMAVLKSQDPLVRLTCGIALLCVAALLLGVPHLKPDHYRKLGLSIVLMMAVSFGGAWVANSHFGGGALNGRVTERGEHFLREHGRETAVSAAVYYFVGTLEMLLFVSWPLGVALALREEWLGAQKAG